MKIKLPVYQKITKYFYDRITNYNDDFEYEYTNKIIKVSKLRIALYKIIEKVLFFNASLIRRKYKTTVFIK